MKEIIFSSEFFNATDTLECGQIFRFEKKQEGYLVISRDKACLVKTVGESTIITCNESDEGYFTNYFDLNTNYANIYNLALNSKFEVLKKSCQLGKGVRILRQDSQEMLYSFLISQNNNIPRIKSIIGKLCEKLGDKKTFLNYEYYAFPTFEKLVCQNEDFYKQLGFGYRAEYMRYLSSELKNGLMNELKNCNANQVKARLLKIKGIGEKVANCACLFGFYKTDSFPVDTWIEKIYREDFNGQLTNPKKITQYFESTFKENSGYFQQYLFYYKRTLQGK